MTQTCSVAILHRITPPEDPLKSLAGINWTDFAFKILNLGHCDLFVICDLVLGILGLEKIWYS
jgi:hypothetical protein